MDPLIILSDSVEPEAERVIRDGLDGFNDSMAGYADRRPLNVNIKDRETGAVLGGLRGRTSLGLFFVELVYLPANLRGRKVGTRMMQMAEDEARRRGCKSGVLFTINFQAPEFYQRLGWRVFGEIACDPAGTSRVFMTKSFR
ncbi:MAG TPA: GNAT family N-acetyltransferase [Acetobacteraceae bacterium]|nr:GNAT family N-acetyltransferase [Acetobacteraceae bacterium]